MSSVCCLKLARSCSLVWIALALAIVVHSQPNLTPLRLDGPIGTVGISPDGQFIAATVGRSTQHEDGTWSSEESLQVIRRSTPSIVARVDFPSVLPVKDEPLSVAGFVGFCDDGVYLVAYDQLSTLYVLDPATYQIERTIGLGKEPRSTFARQFACAAKGAVLAVNDSGGAYGWGRVRVFDLASGKLVSELSQNPSVGTIFSEIDMAPNGSQLAILLRKPLWKRIEGPDVEIHSTKDLKVLSQLSTGDAPQGIAFAGESTIITIQEQPSGWHPPKQVLRVWDIATGREERRLSDARVDVEGPVSASADGQKVLGAITLYHECHLCNGLEGRIDAKEQRFAVWRMDSGAQVFRSEPFGPIIEPYGARCVVSQDGNFALIYRPDSEIMPRVISIR